MRLAKADSFTLQRLCCCAAMIGLVFLAASGGWTRVRAMWSGAITRATVVHSDGIIAGARGSRHPITPQAGCTYTLSSASRTMPRDGTLPFTPDSNPGNIPARVLVKTNPGCAWTATSNASFLAIAPGSGTSGRAEALFTVARNLSGVPRQGTLTIAGQTFTVTQTTSSIPPNDNFANAEVLNGDYGATYAILLNATVEPNDSGVDNSTATVWYRWQAPATGPAVFSMDSIDTGLCSSFSGSSRYLNVYTGTVLGSLTPVAQNWISSASSSPNTNLRNLVGFDATAGAFYYLKVSGSNNIPFSLRWAAAFKVSGQLRNSQGSIISTSRISGGDRGVGIVSSSCSTLGYDSSFRLPHDAGLFAPIGTFLTLTQPQVASLLGTVGWNPSNGYDTLTTSKSDADFSAFSPQPVVSGALTNLPTAVANKSMNSNGFCFFSQNAGQVTYTCNFSIYSDASLAPTATGFAFSPSSQSYGEIDRDQVQDFTAIPAPSVTTNAANPVAAATATLNGTVNPNGLATSAWFEYGTDSTLTTNTQTSSQAVGSGTTNQAISVNLGGLIAATQYYFRAVGSSSGGTVRGSILSFTTTALPRTLTVASTNPASGVPITMIPNDNTNAGNGSTPFNLTYNNNQVVSLIAPATASGNNFQKWLKDGADFTGNASVNVSVTMDANHTMTAVFVTLKTIQFDSANYTAAENVSSKVITVTRSGDPTAPATVDYTTSDSAGASQCNVPNTGNASSRCDYETTIGTLIFAAGEISKTISIPIIDDSYAEGNETFTVTLSNATGAALGTPISATAAILDNDGSANGANPIVQARYFVRMHYLDFLNREPDTSGWDFWTNQITSCGSDVGCTEVKRIDGSASFFLSIEFQQTGYLVERVYKASYGDVDGTSTFPGPQPHSLKVPIVRFAEFLGDTQQITRGVVVLQPGWEQLLESNKVAFFNGFVQRARFTAAGAFPTSLTPTDFVTKLNTNAGNPLSATERNQLISDLTTSTKTRAQVLRAVAEHPNLASSEFNRAFVLMQYFGYLRRNPNDPQDTDYSGYDFWLTKLNQFNGNYNAAEMVKAFITSIEYGRRFGP